MEKLRSDLLLGLKSHSTGHSPPTDLSPEVNDCRTSAAGFRQVLTELQANVPLRVFIVKYLVGLRTHSAIIGQLVQVLSGTAEQIATKESFRCLELGVDLKSFRQAAAIIIRPTAPEKGKTVKNNYDVKGVPVI